MHYKNLEHSIDAGVPPAFLADQFIGVMKMNDRLAVDIEYLREHKFGIFKRLPTDIPVNPIPVQLPPEHDIAASFDEQARSLAIVKLPLPKGINKVVGIRIDFELDRRPVEFQLRLVWKSIDGIVKRVEIYPIPCEGRQIRSFYINDQIVEAHVESGYPSFGVKIHGAEWLVPKE